ncbi:MAG: FliH/SctL family protein [Planctomycetota bacterium]|jgi:flagellar biosynthesis/type III secretory pathway protein FliH
MSRTLTVHLEKPIVSAKILNNYADGTGTESSDRGGINSGANAEQVLTKDLETEKVEASQARQALKSVVDKLNEFYDTMFTKHKEEIAKLSVEIARKILLQKVQEGDYEIESIVKEALKNAPTGQDLVVSLNPEDLVQCQKAQQNDAAGTLTGIKFIADSNVGRAECVVESPKGIIESLFNEQLERIGKALEKAE